MVTQARRSESELKLHAKDFINFTSVLMDLATELPDRTTVSQLVAFLAIANYDLQGRPTTMVDLREALGPSLGKSLHTTYQIFLDRELRRNDRPTVKGLGWLTQEPDRSDYRRNYLHLTAEGREVMRDLLINLKAPEHGIEAEA